MGIFLPIMMLILSYLIGAIPFGLLIGKAKGIDIRAYGSHNIGATNALRTLGTGYGLLVFALDFLKGALFVIITKYLIDYQMPFFRIHIHPLIYGFVAILGHLFPIYLKFKGGKGISCIAGVIIAYSWRVSLIGFFTFVIILALFKFVSLASTCSGFSLFIGWYLFSKNDWYLLGFLILAMIFVVIKHIPNYKRIINGTENKISFSKKKHD